MEDFGVSFERVPLMCDNISAISVAKNPIFHIRMRHLERRHHFFRDHVVKGDIEMRYIDTENSWPIFSPKTLWLGLRGSWCFILYICIFCFSLVFSSFPPKSPCFTCYTSLYLLNYAYLCARMSSNEM
jgi:hypothetical protein